MTASLSLGNPTIPAYGIRLTAKATTALSHRRDDRGLSRQYGHVLTDRLRREDVKQVDSAGLDDWREVRREPSQSRLPGSGLGDLRVEYVTHQGSRRECRSGGKDNEFSLHTPPLLAPMWRHALSYLGSNCHLIQSSADSRQVPCFSFPVSFPVFGLFSFNSSVLKKQPLIY